ncbi:hypothetical protein [Bacillus phage SPO1L1]|nr:hypothetical protein [Bacillus phage SPO1L1]WIT26049.1 hypothetical protein [Bacillus phage SPO1L2]
MSYFKRRLGGNSTVTDGDIKSFLHKEGFKQSDWHGEPCLMQLAFGSLYTVRIMVYPDSIGYYVEYECGGHIDEGRNPYSGFDDFMEEYRITVDSLTKYIN